jgi:glyoxylase-like metal-dependent hydrolase (beta-lactamase superfamily II)
MIMRRREFLRRSTQGSLAAAVSFPFGEALLARMADLPPAAVEPGIHRFRVGSLECVAVSDGISHYPPALFFTNAPATELAQRLAEYGLAPDQLPSSYSCLAVRSGTEWALVDTGIGPVQPGVGQLLPRLREAGIPPEEITTVILTHGHPDHIGGITGPAGQLNFPGARFVMWGQEWDFWTSEARLGELPDIMADFARAHLPPVRDRVELLERETEVHTGITAMPTPGHTPGHMMIGLSSAGEHMLVTGDAILHPINLVEPGWHAVFDMDPEAAMRTRRRVLERAVAEGARLQCFHFHPFPGIGSVAAAQEGWRWTPGLGS